MWGEAGGGVDELAGGIDEGKLGVAFDLAELDSDRVVEEELLEPEFGELVAVVGLDVGDALEVAGVGAETRAVDPVEVREDARAFPLEHALQVEGDIDIEECAGAGLGADAAVDDAEPLSDECGFDRDAGFFELGAVPAPVAGSPIEVEPARWLFGFGFVGLLAGLSLCLGWLLGAGFTPADTLGADHVA
ncbi:MAG: hypothetical protein R3B67_14010 [Phycisphaerales bacterium]